MITAVLEALRGRVELFLAAVRRATVVPALVRLVVLVAGLAALVVGVPAELVLSRLLVLLALLAAAAAVLPRGILPGALLVIAFGGWVYDTAGAGVPVTLPRLLALAAFGYLTHAAAALAAVLPYDALVPPRVLLGPVARAGLVLVVTALAAIGALLAGRAVTPAHLIVASVLGLAVMAVLAGYLAGLLRRAERPGSGPVS